MPTNENVKVIVQTTTTITITDPASIGVDPDGDREVNQAALRTWLRECEGNCACWEAKLAANEATKKVTFSGKIEY